jgi:hypothetical protein
MSQYVKISFSDHDQDGAADDSVLGDCKTYGHGFLLGFLVQRYSAAALGTALIIPEIECVIDLRELCLRRGNPVPASLEARYQEIVDPKVGTLAQINSGKLALVDIDGNKIAGINGNLPSVSNMQIDRRFPHSVARVVRQTSFPVPVSPRIPIKHNLDDWVGG